MLSTPIIAGSSIEARRKSGASAFLSSRARFHARLMFLIVSLMSVHGSAAGPILYDTNDKNFGPAKLIFCEEFDALRLRNASEGAWDASYYWQNKPNGSTLPNEQQWYIDPRFAPTRSVTSLQVDRGVLTITADRTAKSVRPFVEGHPYTSGMLTTGRGFAQKYGYFEMRALLPRGQGLWPAFWLVPQDGTSSHEIDVFEVLGQDPTTLHVTLHKFGPPHEIIGTTVSVADTSTGWHDFAVDWQVDRITWYFDRRPIYELQTPAELNKPMFIILNLAAGGPMPGKVGATTTLPAKMLVDYVRVYSSFPGQGDQGSVDCPVPKS